jgi:hypothetical protein
VRNARNPGRFFAYFSLWILAGQSGSTTVDVKSQMPVDLPSRRAVDHNRLLQGGSVTWTAV